MNLDSLKEKLFLDAGREVVVHSAFRLDDIGHHICAFLNSGGGYLVGGVSDSGDLTGFSHRMKPLKLEVVLRQRISPGAMFSIEQQELDGVRVLIVEVPAGKDIPYSFDNDIYVRSGHKTVKADILTIRDMVFRRQAEPERWERRFSMADPESDLDHSETERLIEVVNHSHRYSFRTVGTGFKSFEELALVKYGRLTNGGDVLLTTNPASRQPQVRVRALRFKSDKSDNSFLDMKEFDGPLMQMLQDTYSFIIRNTPATSRFNANDLYRSDNPVYPESAVREGLVNAFVHRDYSDYSGGLAVHVYPNRLEIWNSGALPAGVTLKKLVEGQISVLRNPDIAHVFYLCGLMEKVGRGSQLIQKACKDSGLPKPVWKSDPITGVSLTLFAPEVTPEVTPEVAPEVTPEVRRLVQTIQGEQSRKELQKLMGLRDDDHFRKVYIDPAMRAGWIEMTIPSKPNSRLQRYRLSVKGHILKQSITKAK